MFNIINTDKRLGEKMKKLLTTALFSAMIVLPSFADNQQPAKYELGKYNFSFDVQEKTQKIEMKTPVQQAEQPNQEHKPTVLPALMPAKPVVVDYNKPVSENTDAKKDVVNQVNQEHKPTILPAKPTKPVVIDNNIKPVSKSIDAQKEVVKQIKQEEQAETETENETAKTVCPVEVQPTEPNPMVIQERVNQELNKPSDMPEIKTPVPCEDDKDEVKTPVPQSSVMPSKIDFKLKTESQPKTHTPMPTQKVLDETHSAGLTNGETPVKRVVQPTKPPAKEQPRPKVVEEETMEEITLTNDVKTENDKVEKSTQTVENTEKSKVDNSQDESKKEEQKVKEKKKLPFSFELHQMQYNGVESRQL